ncbi:glycosyltransferase [Thermosulfuriphilus sp.]
MGAPRIHTLHMIASKTLGGAERFFLRLVEALGERLPRPAVALRKASEVIPLVPPGVSLYELPFRTVWDPFSRMAVSRLINKLRPDIVQTYMGRATRLTRLGKGPPVHIARLGGYYKLDSFRHAHAWVGNTKGICDYLVSAGFPAKRVYLIGNFIDPPPRLGPEELKKIKRRLGLPEDALVLATAGRFIEVKGHRFLLEAFSRLPREIRGQRIFLLMIGDGPLVAALKSLAIDLGIEGRIIWTGWQTNPEVFLQLADLVVFPSLEPETLGNVILEAWALEKPLVVTRFRGALEITRDGDDVWQVPCGDSEALAQGIALVLKDETLAQRLARQGHQRIKKEFSRKIVVDQYLALYEELLAPGRWI